VASMNLRVEGKVILITDGSQGIGAAIARACMNEGAIPVVVDRPDNCFEMIQESAKAFGQIDALVNHFPVNDKGEPRSAVDWLTQRLSSYYALAHQSLPYLKRSKGTITNIASTTVAKGAIFESSCAHGAIQALTREWAAELLPYGIRVNSILPAESAAPEEIAATTLFLISPESAHTTGQHLNVKAPALF
jgi:L-fucose dehydrogenase